MWLPEEDLRPLGEGKYYLFQIVGCSVVTGKGESVGSVKDILFVQGNDLLVVEKKGRESLIPFSESICVEVDVEGKTITIDPPDGLLDSDEI